MTKDEVFATQFSQVKKDGRGWIMLEPYHRMQDVLDTTQAMLRANYLGSGFGDAYRA